MNTFQLQTFIVLLTVGLSANTAWSAQNVPAQSLTGSHSNTSKVAEAKPKQNAGAAHNELPGIMNEEDIPAFLRVDSCDTGDS